MPEKTMWTALSEGTAFVLVLLGLCLYSAYRWKKNNAMKRRLGCLLGENKAEEHLRSVCKPFVICSEPPPGCAHALKLKFSGDRLYVFELEALARGGMLESRLLTIRIDLDQGRFGSWGFASNDGELTLDLAEFSEFVKQMLQNKIVLHSARDQLDHREREIFHLQKALA